MVLCMSNGDSALSKGDPPPPKFLLTLQTALSILEIPLFILVQQTIPCLHIYSSWEDTMIINTHLPLNSQDYWMFSHANYILSSDIK